MIEFALGSLFFFAFLFGIFEVSRVLAVRALIIKGAQDAAVLAAQLPDIDLNYPVTEAGNPTLTSPLYQRYFLARQRVIDEAVRSPLSVFVATPAACPGSFPCEARPVGQRLQTLNTFDIPVPAALGGGLVAMDAILLRPDQTDVAIGYPRRDNAGAVVEVVRYPPAFNIGAGPTGNLQRRFRDFPLVVEVHADVEPLISFIGPIHLVARATSFREPPPESSLSQLNFAPFPSSTTTTLPPTPTPTPTPTLAPTPTPTSGPPATPGPTPTPTTTPTPGPSPSPTATPVPSLTPTATATPSPTPTPTPTICPPGTATRFLSPSNCFSHCFPLSMEDFSLCSVCLCSGS
jgi:hypothetical protein